MILAGISLMLVIITLPFSLCYCVKVKLQIRIRGGLDTDPVFPTEGWVWIQIRNAGYGSEAGKNSVDIITFINFYNISKLI